MENGHTAASGAIALADFLDAHKDDLLATVLAEIRFWNRDEAGGLLNDLFNAELDRLRGRSSPLGEWTAQLVALQQARDGSIDDTLAACRRVRDVVVAYCLGRVGGVSDREVFSIILAAEAHCVKLISRLYAEADRKLAAAQHRLQRAMAESMEAAFVLLNSEGEVVLANSIFADLVGIPEPNLLHCEFPFLCDRDTAGEIRRDLRQKRTTGARVFDGVVVTPKGVSIPARFSVLPIYDEAGLRNGVAVTLSAPEEETGPFETIGLAALGSVTDALEVGVFLLDPSYAVVYTNALGQQAMAGRSGKDAGRAEPGYCCNEYGLEDGQCGTCLANEVFDSGKGHQTTVCRDDAGDGPRWFEIACAPIRDAEGQLLWIVKTVRDVTQQKSLENQVLRQQRTSLVSQLAMAVAHQLRNPLGVMIGYAEMLNRGLPTGQAPEAIEKVLRNGIRCKKIVEDLLEFGKGLPRDQERIDVNKVVTERVQPMYPVSLPKRITWRLADALPPVACAPHQIAQVFVNLIDNALWAAEDHVTVETLVAEGRLVRERGIPGAPQVTSAVCVKVWDDGPGVPAGIRRQIFEPFFTTRREEGGIGLGLSLCRTVVQEHGGELFLDETVSRGTCFVVQLPAVQGAKSAEPPPETVQEPETRGRRILIVDDEEDLLELLATALELRGFQIDTATRASRALELLKTRSYDFAVLDVLLPEDVSGPELYQIILGTNPELAKRTLFITADTMNFTTRQFLEQVKRPFLEKPFLISSFIERVGQLLDAE